MSAPIMVSAAAVTPLRTGDRVLLLRTDAGCVHFLVPASVAAGIFRVTNPHCDTPARAKAGEPLPKPGGQLL